MKKSLLIAALASVVSFAWADQKTVTFDFSKPADYGYTAPEASKGTPLAVDGTIVSDGVTITRTDSQDSNTAVRFYNGNDGISFRIGSGGEITITASDNKILSLSLKGSNCTYGTNFSATPASGWNGSSWSGEAKSIKIARTDKTITLNSMTVAYEVAEGTDTGGVEQYVAVNKDVPSDEFANPTNTETSSTVEFGTDHVKATAVGGITPKDVVETEAGVFPGWGEWNALAWNAKNTNINDVKTQFFYFFEGTGVPYTALNPEAITRDGAPTGSWRASYTYYTPDGANGLPVSGLYYKFTPTVDGKLRMKIWSNKGNRNTFLVDEETKQAVKYSVEGYINGQNEPDPDNEGKNRKKFLSSEQIQAIHNASKMQYTYDTIYTDDTKLTIKERVKKDSVDTAPYVIGAGGQPFWGWVVVEAKANKTYWLFQQNCPIGFGGFDFAYGGSELPDYEKSEGGTAIEQVNEEQTKNNIYDLSGRRVNRMNAGRLYLQNGKKVLVR